MMLTRIVRATLFLGAVCAHGAFIGCGSPTSTPQVNKIASSTSGSSTATKSSSPTESKSDTAAVTLAATDLLKAIKDGKATTAQMSVAFKKRIAEPKTDSDKAVGFSEWEAGNWLKDHQATVGTTNITVGEINSDTFIVTAAAPQATPPVGRTVARMVKVSGAWQLDWLHVAAAGATELTLTGTPAGISGNFVATTFLDGSIQKIKGLPTLLSAPLKKRIAPPLDAVDEALGFNRGILSIKFGNFRDTATSYTISANTNHTNANDSTFTYAGELIAPGGPNRKFQLKLTRGSAPDSWLVDDFQPN